MLIIRKLKNLLIKNMKIKLISEVNEINEINEVSEVKEKEKEIKLYL